MSQSRRYGISSTLEIAILDWINKNGISSILKLVPSVEKLIDGFTRKRGDRPITPWSDSSLALAYLIYALPLNIVRAKAVIAEASRLGFFTGISNYIDFGSGPGTIGLALRESLKNETWIGKGLCVEQSEEAIRLHRHFQNSGVEWAKSQALTSQMIQSRAKTGKSVLFASYSLNELNETPRWLAEFDSIVIIEPSTQECFENMLEFRKRLIEAGFTIWGPCTHQNKCPLSQTRDWCHDRVEFDPPSWWSELESKLKVKNRTITFSYLLASRSKPENQLSAQFEFGQDFSQGATIGRIIGDRLQERGKVRQMICRGENREFLSWLTRDGEPPEWPRGEVVGIGADTEVKANEIRLKPDPA